MSIPLLTKKRTEFYMITLSSTPTFFCNRTFSFLKQISTLVKAMKCFLNLKYDGSTDIKNKGFNTLHQLKKCKKGKELIFLSPEKSL